MAAVWHWLIEPAPSIIEPERRIQARLLMAMLLVLLFVGLLSLTIAPFGMHAKSGASKALTSAFVWITVTGILLLAVEYSLSRTTHYRLAALLAVGTVLGATFLAVIVSPQDLRSVSFLVLGGLVAGPFLSARYGGEEFIHVLPGAPREITQMRAEHRRDGIRNVQLQYDGQTLEEITFSLGVAVFPGHGSTIDSILVAADTALYRAKGEARNRVVAE